MVIYLTTNLITGRKYIGKDSQDKSSYIGSGKILKQAIKKYGKNNFKKEILCRCSSLRELSEVEQYFIAYFNAVNNPSFYNITKGGTGGKTHELKKTKVYQYNIDGTLIKEWESATEASIVLNISRCKITRACTKSFTHAGYLWSRCMICPTQKVKGLQKRKSITVTNNETFTKTIYSSANEAICELGLSRRLFYEILKGRKSKYLIQYTNLVD